MHYLLFGKGRIKAFVDFINVRDLLVLLLTSFIGFKEEKVSFYEVDKSVSKNRKSVVSILL